MIVHLLTYAMPCLFVAWRTSPTTVNTLSQLNWQHFVDFICKCNKSCAAFNRTLYSGKITGATTLKLKFR